MAKMSDFECLHCAISHEINRRAEAGTLCGAAAGHAIARCIANMIENGPAELRDAAMELFFDDVRKERAKFADDAVVWLH